MLKRSSAARLVGLSVIVVFISLIVLALAINIRSIDQRQIVGGLFFDSEQILDQAHDVGRFRLTWNQEDGGYLDITHHNKPDFSVWSSVPGRSFATAGRGDETIIEQRGHFRVEESVSLACPDQTIDAIEPSADRLAITGMLRCADATTATYTLTFAALAPNQLGFDLAVGEFDLSSPEHDDSVINRTYLSYASQSDERFFGFGEQFSAFDLKGKRLPIFTNEQGIGRGAQPLTLVADLQYGVGGKWHSSYAGVPHYITSQFRSLFLENREYAVFDMRFARQVHVQVFSPHMRGRILYGDSPSALIEEYTSYAGRMRPLPDWVHEGAIVSLQGGTERVREIWGQLTEQDIPVAGIWLQDWVGQRKTSFGKQLWWNWELDEDRYPNWDELRGDLATQDVKLLTYINPFVTDISEKSNYNRHLYQEAIEQGYLVKNAAGEPYLIDNSDFSAGLVDLTNPDARDWMRSVISNELIEAGAHGWMADFGEGLPFDAQLASGESAAAYHNRYPEEWAKLNREALDAHVESDELFFFMRSGYSRSPGYSTAFWLGDQLVSWDAHDGIKTAVTGLLSGGMSGYSLNHSDIGGYTSIKHSVLGRHRSEELLKRWMELSAFTTIYRSHESNRPDENVQIYDNQVLLDHFDRFARVYRALAFYRKQLVQEASETGLPVVRHMFIHYPDDANVYDLAYQQFMLGDEFIMAPALDKGTETVNVYLPTGRWVHLWSGEIFGSEERGGNVTVRAPIGEPGVFYKEGSEVAAQFVANLRDEGVIE